MNESAGKAVPGGEPAQQTEKERLVSLSIDMLCVVGFDGYFKYINPAGRKILGFPEEDILKRPLIDFVHPEDRLATREEFSNLCNGIPSLYFENRFQHKGGGFRWLSWTGQPASAEKLIYAVARDVTQQRKTEETLKKLAFTDVLTGLYNRRGFFVVADRMLKIAYRKKMQFLLMIADLDKMKLINDQFGHQEGDAALKATAQIFSARFRESDIVARLGGDEFAAALLVSSMEESRTIQGDMEKSILSYNQQNSLPYRLSFSTGFSYASSERKRSLEQLIAEADEAMYIVKRHPASFH